MQDRSFQEKHILMILTSIFSFRGCLFPFVLQVSGVKVRESGVKIAFPSHASEWKCVSAGLRSAQKSAVHTSGNVSRESGKFFFCASHASVEHPQNKSTLIFVFDWNIL